MNWKWTVFLWSGLMGGLAFEVQAGGSGLNVAVVVNQASSNSVALGNYYCEQRQVPPQNLVRIYWPGGNTQWTRADFQSCLSDPLANALASRGLSNQVELVALSMDIPYRVVQSGNGTNSGVNSTTAVLFYGFHPDDDLALPRIPNSCSLPDASASAYAGSELPFRTVTNGHAWLAFMLTASNLTSAKAIVDRGVASDGTFPTQRVFLTKSGDTARNVRHLLADDADMDSRLLGRVALVQTNIASPDPLGVQLGSQSGAYAFGLRNGLFVPGAMADNLTSYGGLLFEAAGGMIRVPDYLEAGATASYGTVVEPCNWLQKFPTPHAYFYQARGFSIAESYYQSLFNPFQGILVGEPLAAPFAKPSQGGWPGLAPNTALRGITNLTVAFSAADATRPIHQVDLFLDGLLLRTLIEMIPQSGNTITITLDGRVIQYTVPMDATLDSVASGLAEAINTEANTNATRVQAFARGDRVELQSFELGRPAGAILLSAESARGGAAVCTTFVSAARTNFLGTVARGRRGCEVRNGVGADSFLQLVLTKTNGETVSLSVTNPPGNTNTDVLVKLLADAVNAHASLTQPDGIVVEDFAPYYSTPGAEFNLRSRTVGWPESQIAVTLSGSTNLDLTPTNTVMLDENVNDLRPRNHLYLATGTTNLPLTFTLDTTTLADGFHELTAVAYEGSHVRTQARVSEHVRVTNSPLAAVLTSSESGSNTFVTTALQFAVVANTNAVSRIELFSTGGLLAAITNQPSAIFPVAGTNLGVGLHPFYAVVTRDDGQQYRTETRWIRLESPFGLTVTGKPPGLTWPAEVGRTYELLSATNLAFPFEVRTILKATNTPARWTEPEPADAAHFYRVRLLP